MPVGQASCRDSRAWKKVLDLPRRTLSLSQWRARNNGIYKKLLEDGYVDGSLVSTSAQDFLQKRLISDKNPACRDQLNAGHIRAQNENVLFFAGMASISPKDFTIAITAGFIHDLNKSVNDALRQDHFAARLKQGKLIKKQSNLALSVGLNHLGERTRKALTDAAAKKELQLSPQIAEAIDRCIVHHGLGSSKFVRSLIAGTNEWWREVFWSDVSQEPMVVHPAQPPLTMASLIHNLADSAQQMQGDEGWIEKYPFGYWADTEFVLWDVLGGRRGGQKSRAGSSLAEQIEIETSTCNEMLQQAISLGAIDADQMARLQVAVAVVRRTAEEWLDSRPRSLASAEGKSLCHDLAKQLDCSPLEALQQLKSIRAQDPEARSLKKMMIASSRVHHDRFRAMCAELLSKTS